MRGQNFNMASGGVTAPRGSLFTSFFSHTSHHRQHHQQQRPRRISPLPLGNYGHWLSSASSAASKMWCVFVMWTLLSSVGCGSNSGGGGIGGGMVKMSAAADEPSADIPPDSSSSSSSSAHQCVLKGRVYTEKLWYGYLIDKLALHRDYAKIQYTISYPVSECCTNLLIYYDDQIKRLKQDMTCEQREKVLPSNNNQVIPLHTLNRTLGCRVSNETDKPYYVCVGERIFRSREPRTWYFALSRCRAKTPLTINYAFNVSGYYGDCEEDPLVRTYIPPSHKEEHDVYFSTSIAFGVVGAVAFIVAAVFFALKKLF